ncbi:MAG: FtsW/RodA/SpoVE family cell cycle protein, partial [Chlamydiota bacterium]
MRFLSLKALRSIDGRFVFVVLCLMLISLLVISSNDTFYTSQEASWLSPRVAGQLRWFGIGSIVFCFFVALDYSVLRSWSWILYAFALLLLLGLFFTEGRKSVQRWYRIPGLGLPLQPSEFAKLILVITLSAFLEYRRQIANRWTTALWACLIVFIPFVLIYKQPDLGTALLLYPMSMAI